MSVSLRVARAYIAHCNPAFVQPIPKVQLLSVSARAKCFRTPTLRSSVSRKNTACAVNISPRPRFLSRNDRLTHTPSPPSPALLLAQADA